MSDYGDYARTTTATRDVHGGSKLSKASGERAANGSDEETVTEVAVQGWSRR